MRCVHRFLPACLVVVCIVAASRPAFAASMDVVAVSDAVRVFDDGFGLPEKPSHEIRVFALRGETISAQCVIQAFDELKNVTVALSDLENAEAKIPATNLEWNFVEGVWIEKNSPNYKKPLLTRDAPARFPDVLGDDRKCSIAKGATKAVYLTIRVPRDATPGEYKGLVTVNSNAGEATLPISLTVYPLTMPDRGHLFVTEWYTTHEFEKQHGIKPGDNEAFFKMLRLYAENMAEHRQNVFQASIDLIGATRTADGVFEFDFSKFDRWVKVFEDAGRMDGLETGFVAHPGPKGWADTTIALRDFSVKDKATGKSVKIPGRVFLPKFLPAFVKHLREKGWLDKTYFHICDESSNHNVASYRETCNFVHRCAPELRRMDAIETTHCDDRLEVWTPKLDHLAAWWPAYENAQRRGAELWFYTVGIFQAGSLPNKTIDVPLIDSRLLHWLNYRYGVKGYLHWGFNQWTADPINAPGEHRGDGWHVYPKKGGLLNSLRWEQMRNGLEDYECLWLLENEITTLKNKLSPRVAPLIEPRRRSVEIATQVASDFFNCRRDPAALYAARRQAIEETLALAKTPRAILQTTPMENTAVTRDINIDVYGWAEPGSTVKLGGHAIDVAPDGLFLGEGSLSSDGALTVVVEKDGVRKTFVRHFAIKTPAK